MVRYTHRGGMRFLRVGRLQVSFCICRTSIARLPGDGIVEAVRIVSLGMILIPLAIWLGA